MYTRRMIEDVEFRSVIKFLLLKKLPKQDIVREIGVYKEDEPCRATIYNWIREFSSGRSSVQDASRSGRPLEIGDAKSAQLKKLIQEERRWTQQEIANCLNVCKMMAEMGIRKLCSRFVPRFLTAEMKQARRAACDQNLELFVHSSRAQMQNIITMDETPLSLYTPESKRESAEWKLPGEKASRKLKCASETLKSLMLSVFWSRDRIVQLDFTDQNINSEYYCGLLDAVKAKRRKPRNDFLWLHHDNAPVHTSLRTVERMGALGFHAVAQPPYSPDLAPSDFVLFSKLKKHLRGRRFADAEELARETRNFFDSLDQIFFQEAFDEWVHRWQKCLQDNGDY